MEIQGRISSNNLKTEQETHKKSLLSKAQVENESGLYSYKWEDIPNIVWKAYSNIMFKNPRLDCLSVTNPVGKYTVTFHYNASQQGYISEKELHPFFHSHTDSLLMKTEIKPLHDLALTL